MAYNLTNMTGGIAGVFNQANSFTGGLLGWLSSFAIFVTAFLSLSNAGYSTSESFATSSFVTLIIIVPLWIIGFIPDTLLILFGVLSAVSLAFVAMGSSR